MTMHPRVNVIYDDRLPERLKDMTQLEKLTELYKVLSYWVDENYALQPVCEGPELERVRATIALIEKLQDDTLRQMKALGHEVIR